MLQINGTIIVQGLNFAVAYYLLKKLLFKPALDIIDTEEADRKKAFDTIENYNNRIEKKELALQEQLSAYQENFAKEIPAVGQEQLFVFKDVAPKLSYPELSDQEIKRFTDDVVPSLRAKVENVRR